MRKNLKLLISNLPMKAIQFTVPVFGENLFALLEDTGANFYTYYHRHEQLQLTYILKGRGTIMIGNAIQSFAEDDVFIIKPNEPHMLDRYNAGEQQADEDIHAIHLFIDMQRMEQLFQFPDFDDLKAFFLDMDVSIRMEAAVAIAWKAYFLNLLQQFGVPRFGVFIALLHAINLQQDAGIPLLLGFKRLHYSDKDGERISSVFKYTFDHYLDDISIPDVAAIVHMTPTGFCKYFKKHTMKTYVAFLNEVRIEKACQLLLNKRGESIAEVGFKVGFNTIVHFNRMFKKVMKESPGHFVQHHFRNRN